ncbi:MAG: hypothetical protein ABSB35_37725 [Bryobacteraceae bacterium]
MLNPAGGNPHYGSEVRLTVRQDPSNPGADMEAYLGGAWDSTNNFFAGYTLYLYMGSGTGYIYLYRSWTDITWGTPYRLQLAGGTIAVNDGMQMRAIAKPISGYGVQIFVYINNVQVMYYYDPSPPGCGAPTWINPGNGQFGFGVSYATGGTLVSEADLGNIDTIAPNPVSASSIGVSTTTNQVAIQWAATTDDPNGTGIYEYALTRNGQFIGSTTGLSYTDTAGISPSSTYNYTIVAYDFHGNYAVTPFTAVTPGIGTNPPFPSVTPEGRRVGVRPTAAYWGSGSENIDVMSGNLNFTLPLLKAQGRGGWGVGFNLAYNSQLWKQDSGGMWLFDGDVGYGIGWKLQAGSITPVWNPGNMSTAYYLYTDSTGAEYNLGQNNGNVWSSQESVYVYFDANTDILHFRDGSFWYFGCVSAPGEADQGVMHPTIMEDTNGNQILIRYMQSPGANWPESSARITQIEDVRATNQGSSYASYGFTYNSDPVPHLTSIHNYIGTGEAYTFAYSENQPLVSGINGASFGTTTLLDSATVTNLGATHTFTYDGSGEITQITLPYNGYLAYAYRNMTYSSGRTYREVQYRYLSKDGTLASQTTYPFSHEASPGPNVHQYTILDDPGGVGEKYWAFGTSGVGMGLVTQYQGRQLPGPVNKTENDFTWAQDSVGNSYIATTLTTLDSGQSYQAQKETTQTVDTYGNVTQVQNFNFGNLSTPARTYTYTYLNSSAYLSKYIYNRLTGASVTNGTTNITLATNTYDLIGNGGWSCNFGSLTTVSGLREWDTNYGPSLTTRGNLNVSATPSGYNCVVYDETGNPTSVIRNGLTVQVSTASSNNFAAPAQLTTGSLTTNLSWSSFLGLTNETGPNGDSASTYYDQYARQSSTTSPFGATTSYTYSNPPYSSSAPPTVTSTINGRWTRQTLDGLGRTILTQTGDANGTKSQAETVYGSCGCSPTGKMMQTAMPHVVGGTPAYTTYTYDGIGRTLSVVSPDGASTTTYSYQGNLVTVTDPAGKQKTFTMDAFGNLTQVQEPNPQGGSAYVTTYTYDLLNNLSQVSMPRPTGTQTRTFVYNGPYLMSATNPENGTVSYTYNSIYKVATKTDAKGQQVQYT